jgi:hypothetical protein
MCSKDINNAIFHFHMRSCGSWEPDGPIIFSCIPSVQYAVMAVGYYLLYMVDIGCCRCEV